VPLDLLDRLCLDPGTRTIGEFVQEREWAAGEIRRLSLHPSDASALPREGGSACGLVRRASRFFAECTSIAAA
jgi:hypothetical protein